MKAWTIHIDPKAKLTENKQIQVSAFPSDLANLPTRLTRKANRRNGSINNNGNNNKPYKNPHKKFYDFSKHTNKATEAIETKEREIRTRMQWTYT